MNPSFAQLKFGRHTFGSQALKIVLLLTFCHSFHVSCEPVNNGSDVSQAPWFLIYPLPLPSRYHLEVIFPIVIQRSHHLSCNDPLG